ncbi:MAG: SurA N-terminal domain-containing protein [Verrucomicrobiales bacterium]|nr:SurA N-terminal domain-containing protein [Verrucomicrobiales bacterium]
MFQFIRKHQAIGLIFIGIVIVSFVIFFSPGQRGGGGGGLRHDALGSINGRAVTREAYVAAMKEHRLARGLREGSFRDRSERDSEEQREILSRIFLLQEAENLGVVVTDEVAAARIADLPFLKDEKTGQFSRAAYDRFLALVGQEQGITRAEFEEFVKHEAMLQHLVQLTGMSGGLVPPREAEARYRDGNDQYAAQLVVFSASNHLAKVDVSPEKISQYYSNRLADYRIPERVQVRYVKFASSNHLAEADQTLNSNTNLNQLLDAEYTRRGAESFRDSQGNVMTADAAKADIREASRRNVALEMARKKANDFANRLYQGEPTSEALAKLATEFGLTAQTSLPFDQARPPADMRVPATFNRAAFALSAEEPVATPVVGEDGVYVFTFERRVPAEFQPLEDVRARVTEAVRRSEAKAMAEAEGRQFSTAVSNALAQSKSFEAAAKEAGLNAITLTNFSRSTPTLSELGPRLTVSELLRAAEELQPGKASAFRPAADGGYVMVLTSRQSAPDSQLKAELPEFLKQSRLYGRYSAFSEWEKRRFAASSVQLPGMGGATVSTNGAASRAAN